MPRIDSLCRVVAPILFGILLIAFISAFVLVPCAECREYLGTHIASAFRSTKKVIVLICPTALKDAEVIYGAVNQRHVTIFSRSRSFD